MEDNEQVNANFMAATTPTSVKCRKCKQQFKSNNRLHQHIRSDCPGRKPTGTSGSDDHNKKPTGTKDSRDPMEPKDRSTIQGEYAAMFITMEEPAQDRERDLEQLTGTSKSDRPTSREKDPEAPAGVMEEPKNKPTGTKEPEEPTSKGDDATTFVTTEEPSQTHEKSKGSSEQGRVIHALSTLSAGRGSLFSMINTSTTKCWGEKASRKAQLMDGTNYSYS